MVEREQLAKEIRKIVCNVTELPEEKLEGDEHLVDDLGIESVMMVDILVKVQEKYRIEIPEERYEDLGGMDSFVDLVYELIAKG